MQVLTVTFFDETGQEQDGELVDACTIVDNDGKYLNVWFHEVSGLEVKVLTYNAAGGMLVHSVHTGNIRALRPVTL